MSARIRQALIVAALVPALAGCQPAGPGAAPSATGTSTNGSSASGPSATGSSTSGPSATHRPASGQTASGASGQPARGTRTDSSPGGSAPTRTPTSRTQTSRTQASPTPKTGSSAERQRPANIDDPDSITVVVNKHRPLEPATYAPSDLVSLGFAGAPTKQLRREAAQALRTMMAAAADDGVTLGVLSAYRSHQRQRTTYRHWVAALGSAAQADHASARPGYSEHQTGLAVDIGAGGPCALQPCFASTPAAKWAGRNAHRFGFIIRYKLGHHPVTGYYAEPWHLRYVGVPTAKALHRGHVPTLEEYFGLPPAPDYR